MAKYTLVLNVETDDEDNITMQDIRDAFYDAGGGFPFTYDIVSMKDEK